MKDLTSKLEAASAQVRGGYRPVHYGASVPTCVGAFFGTMIALGTSPRIYLEAGVWAGDGQPSSRHMLVLVWEVVRYD